jgi:hypothetical protein
MPGARRMSVTISQDMAEILERAVACGDYASPQAIIRAALSDWRQQWLTRQPPLAEPDFCPACAAGPAGCEQVVVDGVTVSYRWHFHPLRKRLS